MFFNIRDVTQSADAKLETFHHCLASVHVLTKIIKKVDTRIRLSLEAQIGQVEDTEMNLVEKMKLNKVIDKLTEQLCYQLDSGKINGVGVTLNNFT